MTEHIKADSAVATVRGSFWSFLSHFSGRLITFLCTVILSRLLSTEDFGVAGYALITIGLLDVLTDLGIGTALIYYRDDPRRIHSAFWLGLIFGLSLFTLTWIFAPVAAYFFHDERAVSVIRTLAFVFPISALSNVHDSLLQKQLSFGKKMIPDVLRIFSKGIFSILFAISGFGAYSLIYGYIVGTAVSVIAYWWNHPWRPSLQFQFSHTRELLTYGIGIVTVNAMAGLLMNVDYLFVGHYLGAVALGVYTLSFRVPELLIKDFCGNVGKVVFPVYTKLRNDTGLLSEGYLATLRYITMFTIPAAIGLALIARPFVLTLFSEKWKAAIPVIPAIAIYTLFRSLTFNAGDIYKAQGRIRLLNKLSLLQAMILLPSLWWSVSHYRTINAVAWTQAIVAFIGMIIRLSVTSRVLKIKYRMILSALEPTLIASAFMAFAVAGTLALLKASAPWLQLAASVLTGGIVYFTALWWFRPEVMLKASSTLRMAFARR